MLRPVPTSTPVGVLLVILSIGLACNLNSGFADQPQNATGKETQIDLHITVLEGEDGANILKNKMAVKPVIEVRDRNNLPVSGVAVVFAAPESGPRVAFAHGSNTFVTTTDANGRAVVANSKPVGRGPFKIRVKADFHGQTVTASISQTNYVTAAAATTAGAGAGAGAGAATAGAGISGAVIGGIVAGAAAVAVGLGVGLTRGGRKLPPAPLEPPDLPRLRIHNRTRWDECRKEVRHV